MFGRLRWYAIRSRNDLGFDPERISAISRWLSAATPPDGEPPRELSTPTGSKLIIATTPLGSDRYEATMTGGALRDPRLIAITPVGVKTAKRHEAWERWKPIPLLDLSAVLANICC